MGIIAKRTSEEIAQELTDYICDCDLEELGYLYESAFSSVKSCFLVDTTEKNIFEVEYEDNEVGIEHAFLKTKKYNKKKNKKRTNNTLS